MSYSDREQKAIEFTIGKKGGSGNEGGFSDNKNDHGGATFSGFTLATVRQLSAKLHGFNFDYNHDGEITAEDLKHLTYDELEAMADTYYDKDLDQLKPGDDLIAIKVFDFGFNCGIASGVKLFQTAVNMCNHNTILVADGNLGPKTIVEANRCDTMNLLNNLIQVAKAHYETIVRLDSSQRGFLEGWITRAERLPV